MHSIYIAGFDSERNKNENDSIVNFKREGVTEGVVSKIFAVVEDICSGLGHKCSVLARD